MNRPQAARPAFTREDALNVASALLALGALWWLPWPGFLRGTALFWAGWALLELSFLLPLLPALLAGAPPVVRAGVREAQIGALGRATCWMVLGALMELGGRWELPALTARLLALAAIAFALPAALGWGAFGELPGWPGSSAEAGLPERAVRLRRVAYGIRCGAVLLAALLIALPLPLPAPLALALTIAAASLLVLVGVRSRGVWPRLTLDAALRHCVVRALPIAIAAIIYSAALAGVGA